MLTKPSAVTNTIQSLSDKPNQTDGLTAAQVKLKFDQYAIDNNSYLENVLTVELDTKFTALDATILAMTPSTTGYIQVSESQPVGNAMWYKVLE